LGAGGGGRLYQPVQNSGNKLFGGKRKNERKWNVICYGRVKDKSGCFD
jgi:hypothetical protein